MNEAAFPNPLETDSGPRRDGRAIAITGCMLAAAALVWVYVNPVAAMAVAVIAAAIPYWRLEYAFFAFLVTTLLWPHTMAWQVGFLAWMPSRVMYVVLVITWLVALVNKEVSLKRTPIDPAILIFVVAITVSLVINSLYMDSVQFTRSIKTLATICVEFILMFYIVTTIPRDWKQVRKLLAGVIIVITVVAIIGIIEYITKFRVFEWLRLQLPGGETMRSNLHELQFEQEITGPFRGGVARIVSTTISPHEVATLMAMSLPLILYFLGYARSKLQTLLAMYSFLFVILALLMSVTRGALIAAVVAVICSSVLSRKGLIRMSAFAMILVAALMLILTPGILGAIESVTNPKVLSEESSLQSRIEDWPVAITVLKGNELAGIGLGQVTGQQLSYGVLGSSFKYTDNYYLSAIVETGIIGLGAFLLLWVAFIVVMTRRQKLRGDEGTEIRDLRIAVFSSMVVFMIMNFTYSAFSFVTASKFFWIVAGLGIALVLIEKRMTEGRLS